MHSSQEKLLWIDQNQKIHNVNLKKHFFFLGIEKYNFFFVVSEDLVI